MPHRIIKLQILAVLVALLISSCTTYRLSDSERTEAYVNYIDSENLEKVDRVIAFKFYNWSSLGQQHLIISTHVNKAYLITLRHLCYDLRFAQTIKINSTGSVLDSRFDSITVPQTQGLKCYIKSIHKLNSDQRDVITKIRSMTVTENTSPPPVTDKPHQTY